MSQLRIQDERIVAYRALSLGALLKRAELEVAVRNDDFLLFDGVREHAFNKQSALNNRLLQWLHDEKIISHLSESERHLFEKPLGSWSERALISVGWRTEALGVMLWALRWLDRIPAYDRQFELEDVIAPLDLLGETIDFIWSANLRSDDELSQSRDQAELWNWRSRATELERMGVRPPDGVTFGEIIHMTAERAYTNGHLPTLIDSDFPAFNKAYADQSEDEYAITSGIAYERYFALNWICELSSEWENIRIDT